MTSDFRNSAVSKFLDFEVCQPANGCTFELDALMQVLGKAEEPTVDDEFPLLRTFVFEWKRPHRQNSSQ